MLKYSSTYYHYLLNILYIHLIYGIALVLDPDVRLARRIRRDTVERGRDINSVLEQVKYQYSFLNLD